jgi:nucleoside-diphosphate-sugar epimerase
MKVFVAGATGALGRQLVPQLVARGHDVVGMTRSESKQDLVHSLGARPVVADALDRDAVARAVASAEPEVIVHQLTAPLTNVAYHVRKLADLGAVALVDSRPVRGALEHFYRRAWVIDVRYRQDTSKKSATLDGR